MHVLVVNAGSTSLKLRLLGDDDTLLAWVDLGPPEAEMLEGELDSFLAQCPPVDAVGHRVVHGGAAFTEPLLLSAETEDALAALADLAPLHNPPGLAAVRALRALRPDLPQVACFDTSFHATMPPWALTYAVPRSWRERWGIRRYGFHGLSHAWASRRGAALLGRAPEELGLVTAHLGAGASLAAVAGGRSVDTTMGFTPLDGLVMATRSGSLDPGAVLWVQRHGGLSTTEVEDILEHRSGLLGLSGTSGDLRAVLASLDAGDEEATLAYQVYVYRIRTAVGAMVAALGGLHGLVFTGGAGEASARLRSDVCAGLGHLGVRLDAEVNGAVTADALVSPAGAAPAVLVVQAREDLEIARHVRLLVG